MAPSKNNLDISVLIATYNRAEILRQTLESMTGLERDGLSVEFVVVDNNSSDHTKEVIESFIDRLPIHYLFEPRPGKNCALNKALDEAELGKLVVFTDDDVKPQKDWLRAMIAISERWPEYKVFGGRIYLIMPEIEVPYWNQIHQILAFGEHDYADTERPYSPKICPNGANFWVRRKVFNDGRRYKETVGPHPTNRIMGSETSFLEQLMAEGDSIVYSPSAMVGHCIQLEQLTSSGFRRRAYRFGRSYPHRRGLKRRSFYRQHPRLWLIFPILSLIRHAIYYALALFSLSSASRVVRELEASIWIGYNIESLKIATTLNKKSKISSTRNDALDES